MNFFWHSRKPVDYKTSVWKESLALPGVNFAVRRPSLGERIQLTARLRQFLQRDEFLRAGHTGEQIEAALNDLLVKAAYVEWGLMEVTGLRIDGRRATPEDVLLRAPEVLLDEIVAAIKTELGLTQEERKNF